MHRISLTRQRLTALAFVGLLLFFSPLTGVFDRPVTLRGIPLLPLYLFSAWALLIALSAWIQGAGGK
jgi:hypothetical protein